MISTGKFLRVLGYDDEGLAVDAGRGVQGPGQGSGGHEDDEAVEQPHAGPALEGGHARIWNTRRGLHWQNAFTDMAL